MKTETVVEGLWALADEAEQVHRNIPTAIKCLETAVASGLSLLPLAEVRTRLRLAQLLLSHTHNLTHAKSHLERAHLLLARIPSALPLKLRAHSLLSHAYHLTGSIPPQKHILIKALHLLETSEGSIDEDSLLMWTANFNAQLASAMAVEGDYAGALGALTAGMEAAEKLGLGLLRMFFAASALHVQLLHWEDSAAVEAAAGRCEEIWNSIGLEKVIS